MFEQFTLYLASDQLEQDNLSTENLESTGRKGEKKNQSKLTQNEDNSSQGSYKTPALQKLHNIATWLRTSSIHNDHWDDIIGLRLGIDNNTRWNSWYTLINHLMRKQDLIKQFLHNHDEEIGSNILQSKDWDILTKIHLFLQPFASATLWAQKLTSSLSQSLQILDGLLLYYEKKKVCSNISALPLSNFQIAILLSGE